VALAEPAGGVCGECGNGGVALDERGGGRGDGRVGGRIEEARGEFESGEHGAESAEAAGGGEAGLPVGVGVAAEEFGEVAETAEVAPLVPSTLASEVEG